MATINKSDASQSWRKDKASSASRGYGYKWQQARAGYLAKHPLCVYCQRLGRVTAASVVDHIDPHKGNMSGTDSNGFWNRSNWQGLCSTCHDTVKAEEEGRHKVKASFGADGRVVW